MNVYVNNIYKRQYLGDGTKKKSTGTKTIDCKEPNGRQLHELSRNM